jgi:hypothetical protein
MYAVKCDFCKEYKAMPSIFLNGYKSYMCYYCANELDKLTRKRLGKDILHKWAMDKEVARHGDLDELTLRALVKEIQKQEADIFKIQREWAIENVNDDVRERIVESLVDYEVLVSDE